MTEHRVGPFLLNEAIPVQIWIRQESLSRENRMVLVWQLALEHRYVATGYAADVATAYRRAMRALEELIA